MPELTSHIGLKKPLKTEIADITVLNENMDVIDLAIGDLTSVPTIAKDAAGAITELFEALENADIPDATLTTKGKVQLSSATNSTAENLAATPKAVNDVMNVASTALPKSGGQITGLLRVETTGREISAGSWVDLSANSSGYGLIAQNCYTSNSNEYRFSNSHATMGARGIRFNHASITMEYFDTGAIATTADAIFTPTWISMRPDTAATANRTVLRDSAGRAKVAAPVAMDDIARLAEVNTRLPLSGGNMTGPLNTTGSVGAISSAGGGAQFSVNSDGTPGSAAFAMFHRPGLFAGHFGIDTDNKWKVGGYSAGAVAHELWHDGRLRVNANKLQFYNGGAWNTVAGYGSGKTGTSVINAEVAKTVLVINVSGQGSLKQLATYSNVGLSYTTQVIIDGILVYEVAVAGENRLLYHTPTGFEYNEKRNFDLAFNSSLVVQVIVPIAGAGYSVTARYAYEVL
ncbi:tail fiber protein [Cohnella herbarum]|uniref:tail fiber protein n=1 Tax=Cohnella herbarum TaxID=2728023 RepID=UPI001C2BFAA3|nr:phage tail protein [Cohnella herbarum]